MAKKLKNEANFKAILGNGISGAINGIIFQKNGIVRTNRAALTKKDLKKVVRDQNLI